MTIIAKLVGENGERLEWEDDIKLLEALFYDNIWPPIGASYMSRHIHRPVQIVGYYIEESDADYNSIVFGRVDFNFTITIKPSPL